MHSDIFLSDQLLDFRQGRPTNLLTEFGSHCALSLCPSSSSTQVAVTERVIYGKRIRALRHMHSQTTSAAAWMCASPKRKHIQGLLINSLANGRREEGTTIYNKKYCRTDLQLTWRSTRRPHQRFTLFLNCTVPDDYKDSHIRLILRKTGTWSSLLIME